MSAWKYKQLTPSVLAEQLRLLRPREMTDLVGKPMDYIYSQLAKTPYQRELSEISPELISSSSVEKALLRNYIKTAEKIARASPKDIHALLDAILAKFEASTLKTILRMKSAGIEVGESLQYIVPTGSLSQDKCIQIMRDCETVHDVVDLLSHSEYGLMLEGTMEDYERTGTVFPFEVIVDRHVYDKIWKAAEKLKGSDRRIAKTILGLEIDSLNIRVVLRLKQAGMSEERIGHYVLPISDVFPEEQLSNAIRQKDVKQTIEQLLESARFAFARDHQRLLIGLAQDYESRKSLSSLEMALDRELLKANLRMLKRYTPFFNLGLVLEFLNLKWFELRNLRSIIRGVEEKLASAKIIETLVLPS